MDRRALTRGGVLAALALLALYALLGGESDLGSDENTGSTRATTTVESPTPQADQSEPAEASDAGPVAGFSEEESAGIAGTLAAIESGGELPYDQDGDAFQNREGRLPSQPQGYYREYTVITPGSDDRGARRLVIGDGGETFYTRDHYDSFIEIDPERFQ
ncbi:MAG: hypothetical protein M3O25_04955 [Actinomycetota bacterium]|nr:hypothetical protein [Actinomycetota bacterium]